MSDKQPSQGISYLPRSWGANARGEKASESESRATEAAGPGMSQETNEKLGDSSVPISHEGVTEGDRGHGLPSSTDSSPCANHSACQNFCSQRDKSDMSINSMPGNLRPGLVSVTSDGVDGNLDETMPKKVVSICGVRFGYAGKVYHFEAGGIELVQGDWVIVKTEKGVGLGQVALQPHDREMEQTQLEGLRKVLRKAGKIDFNQKERCMQKEKEAYLFCLEGIADLGLPMKLVAVECFFDASKYVFYFTAEGRVDFRELVKELVVRFPVRIEMRQIGVRHEAKMIGGLATCGQELCCSRYLTDFRPVSVKMAKNQSLSLNPTKISGVCGRLMCCLGYEHDTYEEFKKGLPKIGRTVRTSQGEGVVLKHNPLSETVFVRLSEDVIVEVCRDEIVAEVESVGRMTADASEEGYEAITGLLDEDGPEEL